MVTKNGQISTDPQLDNQDWNDSGDNMHVYSDINDTVRVNEHIIFMYMYIFHNACINIFLNYVMKGEDNKQSHNSYKL